jgi:hypothetical protein
MITRLRQPLDEDDFHEPIVAAVAVADLALEALVAAFFAAHPRLDHETFLRPAHWDIELRHAQLAASLSRALQRALADYATAVGERLKRKRCPHIDFDIDDDIPF